VYQITEFHKNLAVEKNLPQEEKFFLPFEERYPELDWYYGRVSTQMDMLKKAMEKAKSTDPTKVAFALEGMTVDTAYGEATMRQLDHQMLQPLFLSVFSKDVKYDVENTGFGFKTVAEFPAEETASPTTCQMKRPKQ
jgi:branched-chain amino acid transport system substrate-binding protein